MSFSTFTTRRKPQTTLGNISKTNILGVELNPNNYINRETALNYLISLFLSSVSGMCNIRMTSLEECVRSLDILARISRTTFADDILRIDKDQVWAT